MLVGNIMMNTANNMDAIERKTMQDIKDYVKSLNRPDNEVYQKNSLLIMSCFSKALEFIEMNSELRRTISIESICGCDGETGSYKYGESDKAKCSNCGKEKITV